MWPARDIAAFLHAHARISVVFLRSMAAKSHSIANRKVARHGR